MKEEIQIKAVDMVRRIRDEQSQILSGKSQSEIMAFFKRAGESARQKTKKGRAHGRSRNRKAIGIGTPVTERPSHTTGRTGHVSGDSAGQNRHR